MQEMKRTTWNTGTPWLTSVLILSLPSVIFAILHALYAPATLPDLVDLVVAWTITLTGMFGPVATLAACVVSLVATFQDRLPRTAKVAMWALVSLSFLACLYIARAPI
jgi:hypothetical protein